MTNAEIQIEGCVKAGVEAGCIILVTSDGKEYSLHGKSLPTLGKGLGVTARGTLGGVDTCMQGKPFQIASWNWNKQRCPKEERGATSETKIGSCSGWTAWHDRMPGSAPTLHVTGKCVFPTSGYKVMLAHHGPQGINPAILILDRIVQPPAGKVSQAVTTVEVQYTEETKAVYTNVTILPDDITIPVKEIQ